MPRVALERIDRHLGTGRWRPALLLLVTLVACATGLTVRGSGLGRSLEYDTVDARFDIRGAAASRKAPIVIVGIDANTVGNFGSRVPRKYHVQVIRRLHAAGARLIAYDIWFRASDSADPDLLRAAKLARPMIVATKLVATDGFDPVLGERGQDPFNAVGAHVGWAHFPTDADDVVRRMGGPSYGTPTFAVAVARALHHRVPDKVAAKGGMIDFAGPAGAFPQISFLKVLRRQFDPDTVRNKIVVVGDTASTLPDVHPTATGTMPGSELQANAISTVLRDLPLRPASLAARTLSIIVLALLVPLLGLRFGGLACAGAAAAATVLWLIVAQVVFNGGAVLDVVAPLGALLVATAGTVTIAAIAERSERQHLRAMFAADSPEVVEKVLGHEPVAVGPNAIVAGYKIEQPIGRGGMGVVYRARQLALEREVALKLIAPDRAADRDFRERFRRESLTAAATEHPNVIPVYEAGDDDGLLYIAMRLVDGLDLGRTVESLGPLPPDEALRLVKQVAGALGAAHDRGLIHRDVKPANILLTADTPTHAYLTDFGLARHVEGSQLTRSSAWAGTIDYVAPEQIRGEPVGPAADLYALAGVLYFSLVGEPPFPRDNDAATMFAHVSADPPRPSEQRRTLPQELDSVLATGLAKNPDERPDLRAFVDAVSAALRQAS